ncbi:MAG: response regulator [Prevotella sp.]|nr:response regulator [Prevotella sp.]
MFKVIIIDDERSAIDILSQKLNSRKGFTVAGTAQNGEQGLQLIKDEEPDIVFLDIEMPDMNGIDFMQKMEERGLWCYVVMCTSYSEYVIRAFRNHAFDYLMKPVEDEELDMILQRIANEQKPQQQQSQGNNISKHINDSLLFYLNTVDFQLIKIQDIGVFQYNHDQRVWEAVVANQQNPIRLKRNVTNETLLSLDGQFIQVNQKYIVNISCLMKVKDNYCHFYPPFDHISYVKVGRFFRKRLIERFRTL